MQTRYMCTHFTLYLCCHFAALNMISYSYGVFRAHESRRRKQPASCFELFLVASLVAVGHSPFGFHNAGLAFTLRKTRRFLVPPQQFAQASFHDRLRTVVLAQDGVEDQRACRRASEITEWLPRRWGASIAAATS